MARTAAADETRRRLCRAAQRSFSSRGFDGTSMRQVIADAGVGNLAAVHYHFGSKQALFDVVLTAILRRVNDERLRRLDALESEHPRPSVALLVRALVEPLTDLARARDDSALVLLARSRIETGPQWRSSTRLMRPVFDRYVDAFGRALPGLSEGEVARRLYVLMGSIAVAIIDARGMGRFGHGMAAARDPDALSALICDLFAAGMQVPAG